MQESHNNPDAVNPAMTLRLAIEDQWRRVTDPDRSTMQMTPTSSILRTQGSPSDSATASASSGRRRRHETAATPIVWLPSDRAFAFRAFRAFRGEEGHTLSNHSVEANRRPAAPLDAGSQFGSPSPAPPYPPAAVAHLGR
jgi:hypothetical protein